MDLQCNIYFVLMCDEYLNKVHSIANQPAIQPAAASNENQVIRKFWFNLYQFMCTHELSYG